MNIRKGFLFGIIISNFAFSITFADVTMKRFGQFLSDSATIFSNFLQDPIETSAIMASSPWAVDNIIKDIESGNILEIGAGPGNVTYELIKQLNQSGKDYHLDVVEQNPEMFEKLRDRVSSFNSDKITLRNCFFGNDECPLKKDSFL